MSHPQLTGPSRKPLSGAAPQQLIVFMHGWGADGANLIDIAGILAPEFPGAQFTSPNAPFPCEANTAGYQWFSLMDRNPGTMQAGVRNAADIFNAFLDAQLAALGLDESKLALIGFSQGTMTALQVATRRAKPVAALVGFSGALIGAELLAQEIVSRPPVCLLHGEMDEVVPFGALAHAEDALKAAKVPVEAHPRPFLGHSIDMGGLEIATKFLKKNL